MCSGQTWRNPSRRHKTALLYESTVAPDPTFQVAELSRVGRVAAFGAEDRFRHPGDPGHVRDEDVRAQVDRMHGVGRAQDVALDPGILRLAREVEVVGQLVGR